MYAASSVGVRQSSSGPAPIAAQPRVIGQVDVSGQGGDEGVAWKQRQRVPYVLPWLSVPDQVEESNGSPCAMLTAWDLEHDLPALRVAPLPLPIHHSRTEFTGITGPHLVDREPPADNASQPRWDQHCHLHPAPDRVYVERTCFVGPTEDVPLSGQRESMRTAHRPAAPVFGGSLIGDSAAGGVSRSCALDCA